MDIAEPSSVLSASEWRVATVVGAGSTNKAVARDLGISIKTVEFHLVNVYRKLGISSRTQLANMVAKESERLRESSRPVGSLSRQSRSLIGRETALAELVRLTKAHPLVTLTGVGGVGKSSLALAVAE